MQRGYLAMLGHPGRMLVGLTGALLLAAGFASRFSFDASADTLVVEDDPDLQLYREISAVFGGDDFLLVTFTPHAGELLASANLDALERLQRRLGEIEGVTSVFSVLDAPLLKSPPVSLDELAEGFRTLRSADVDLALAAEELASSPFFRELLISADGRTAALRVDILPMPMPERADTAERRRQVAARAALIEAVRGLRTEFSPLGVLHLGGVPMIASDMIAFVKSDLAVFGGLVLVLVMAVLRAAFGQLRWVLLPLGCAAAGILATLGVLGFLLMPATVISSNFVALMAIMTISLTIHLIVRYRELLQAPEPLGAKKLVAATMTSKFAPCLYTALTTMAAFGSLTVSSIVPVEDFGWMMCIGLVLGFLVTFILFPAVLMLLDGGRPRPGLRVETGMIQRLSALSQRHPGRIAWASLAAAAAAAAGIAQLSVDNRFIDYFKDDTDINQGMVYIDRHLGGTAPFDLVLNFEPWQAWDDALAGDDLFADDPFAEAAAGGAASDPFPERYWFTRDKLDRIGLAHRLLEARPEVGKVVSLASLDELARQFNDGEPLNNVQVAAVLAALPPDLRDEVIRPYASPATGQARLWARVIESGPYFDRDQLVADIKQAVVREAGFADGAVAIAGMVVLFNGMVRKLVSSQVDTLGYVLLATFLMFLVLLRSPLFALLGMAPNILAAAAVLAVMGFVGIPLNMMTAAIAAVSIGIGVDFAIHYLHRYRRERALAEDPGAAVARTHGSIGRALFLTGLTIMVGFSVLCFSNFVPTIMFGLLVALAMALAFLANLTLLPSLLVLTDRRRNG